VWLRVSKPLPLIETSPPGKAAAGFTLSIRGVPFDFNLIGPGDATLRSNYKTWRSALRRLRIKRPALQKSKACCAG
jgi:hypothetical protein